MACFFLTPLNHFPILLLILTIPWIVHFNANDSLNYQQNNNSSNIFALKKTSIWLCNGKIYYTKRLQTSVIAECIKRHYLYLLINYIKVLCHQVYIIVELFFFIIVIIRRNLRIEFLKFIRGCSILLRKCCVLFSALYCLFCTETVNNVIHSVMKNKNEKHFSSLNLKWSNGHFFVDIMCEVYCVMHYDDLRILFL